MPPKNKKQLQQQARRLQQQQRKRQQEERRLEQQRKKYASQILNTDIVLPVSNQLISDFSTHQSSFINQKLTQVLLKLYPDLKDTKTFKQLLKQILYTIKNSINLFNLGVGQNNEQISLKIRVVCGFYLKIFLNDHPTIQKQKQKDKVNDQNLLKQLLIAHSQSKNQKQKKVFNKNQVVQILKYFKQSYFNHFLILHKFSNFPKRQDHKSFNIYIAAPSVQFNTVHTTFIDLSNRNKSPNSNQNEEKKSDNTD